MDATLVEADPITLLEDAQSRVRKLARDHVWFAEAVRDAFDRYRNLLGRYQAEADAMRTREWDAARALVASGRLRDPKLTADSPHGRVKVQGLCPKGLAERLGGCRSAKVPLDLQREAAPVVLAAMDRHAIYQWPGLSRHVRNRWAREFKSALKAGSHVQFTWWILIAPPVDRCEMVNPATLDADSLGSFSDDDYRTIALYRLGGLADLGSTRPLVRCPPETGNFDEDMAAYSAWRARFPIDPLDWDCVAPPIDPLFLPPDVAEQMIDDRVCLDGQLACGRHEALSPGH